MNWSKENEAPKPTNAPYIAYKKKNNEFCMLFGVNDFMYSIAYF